MTERKEQFTPGPWSIHHQHRVRGEVYSVRCKPKRDELSPCVAMVYNNKHFAQVCNHSRSNAALIAAAPELYEALKELIAVLCHDGRDLSQEICTKMHDAESALAAARSEQ